MRTTSVSIGTLPTDPARCRGKQDPRIRMLSFDLLKWNFSRAARVTMQRTFGERFELVASLRQQRNVHGQLLSELVDKRGERVVASASASGGGFFQGFWHAAASRCVLRPGAAAGPALAAPRRARACARSAPC